MKKLNKSIITGAILFLCFVIFTILVKFAHVSAIGPLNSSVGFSEINLYIFNHTKHILAWHYVSEAVLYLSFAVAIVFACVGIAQLIKRKNIKDVDKNLILLGAFFIVVALIYIVFEFVVINFRPILIDGVLEASYPSSHTMISVFLIGSALIELHKMGKFNKWLILSVDIFSIALLVLGILGRLFSGMHWFTDVFAGVLLSVALLFIFYGLRQIVSGNNKSSEKDID